MRLVIRTIKQVFQNPLYVVLAIVVGGLLLAFAIWLPNLRLITRTLQSDTLTFTQKTNVVVALLGALQTNFTPLSRAVTITISILFAINTALMTYYFRTRLAFEKEVGVSLGGMMAGLLGVGCASCGSVILATLFGMSATAGFLGIFPLRGQEFGILGIFLLIASIYLISKKIGSPVFCKVVKSKETHE